MIKAMRDGVSIIIPTYNGGSIFSQCLEEIARQKYNGEIQLIVVDSGSIDGTAELAEQAGALLKRIEKKTFHHAGTRNYALSFARFNKVIYLVQDAVPCSDTWLSDLEESLSGNSVVAVYAKQIPHDDSDAYARFEVENHSSYLGQDACFQYIESKESFQDMPYDEAYRTVRMDNICAIYEKEALLDIPFPEVDFAEDMAWAFKNLQNGRRIMYQPEVRVKHSHNRSAEYRFNRAVVNSIACARIMNRVKDDLSSLLIRDLISLTNIIQGYSKQIISEILENRKSSSKKENRAVQIIDVIVTKYSFSNRMKKIFLEHFPDNLQSRPSSFVMIERQCKEYIHYFFELIRKTYGVTAEEELIEILKQVIANVLGRVYGEVYAARMLKNNLTPEIEDFIDPFLKDV